jgi:acyl-CoA thioesterase-1
MQPFPSSARHSPSAFTLLVGVLIGIVGCNARQESRAPAAETAQPAALRSAREADHTGRPRIVALGDSLTAGLGLIADEAYPALLQQRLDEKGYSFEVVNAGVSGDTTAGGLRRLDWALDGDVRILIVALGGNDGLRGLPVGEMKRNLSQIITRAQRRDIAVLLVGIEAPPNFGENYTSAFRQTFPDLARQHRVASVPFLLDGIAGVPQLNQRDGIHPSAEGARIIANTIWSALEPMLASVRTS